MTGKEVNWEERQEEKKNIKEAVETTLGRVFKGDLCGAGCALTIPCLLQDTRGLGCPRAMHSRTAGRPDSAVVFWGGTTITTSSRAGRGPAGEESKHIKNALIRCARNGQNGDKDEGVRERPAEGSSVQVFPDYGRGGPTPETRVASAQKNTIRAAPLRKEPPIRSQTSPAPPPPPFSLNTVPLAPSHLTL